MHAKVRRISLGLQANVRPRSASAVASPQPHATLWCPPQQASLRNCWEPVYQRKRLFSVSIDQNGALALRMLLFNEIALICGSFCTCSKRPAHCPEAEAG
jgi:hypothetical protein